MGAAAAGQDGTRQTPEQRTEEISRDPVTGVGCSLLITVTLASRAANEPLRSLKFHHHGEGRYANQPVCP